MADLQSVLTVSGPNDLFTIGFPCVNQRTCPPSSHTQATSPRRIGFSHLLVPPYYRRICEWQGDLRSIESDLNWLRMLLPWFLSRWFIVRVRSLASMLRPQLAGCPVLPPLLDRQSWWIRTLMFSAMPCASPLRWFLLIFHGRDTGRISDLLLRLPCWRWFSSFLLPRLFSGTG